MTPSDKPLTARQQQCLDFICRHIDQKGRPPTLREIGETMNVRSTNAVNDYLKALAKKGKIRRDRYDARGIAVVGESAADVRAERDRLRVIVERMRVQWPVTVAGIEDAVASELASPPTE